MAAQESITPRDPADDADYAHRRLVNRALRTACFPDAHAEAVAHLAEKIATHLCISDRATRAISLGALAHDIGKLAIDPRTLNKPGPLDENEWRQIRRHPIDGERYLQGLLADEVLAIIRSHHERWDGGGYPDALAGDQIPLGARIVGVADAYCAMIEWRPYRERLEPQQAICELQLAAGSQFDPSCVRGLVDLLDVAEPAA